MEIVTHFLLPLGAFTVIAIWLSHGVEDFFREMEPTESCPVCGHDDIHVINFGADQHKICCDCHHQWPAPCDQ